MIPVAKWLGAPVTSGVTTGTRAKDGDRQETCKLLDEALNDGELTMAEHRERIGAATNAVTLGDLQALLTDLQTDSTPVPRSPCRCSWVSALAGVCTATPDRHWTSPAILEPSPTESPPWC